MITPRRTPRVPIIGLCSAQLSAAASIACSFDDSLPFLACLTFSSSTDGRNSCSGGSSRRTVTGQPVHRLEDLLEVGLLRDAQLLERGGFLLRRVGEDHLAHDREPVGGEEHVLGAAQADALGAERTRVGGVLAGVGVGTHGELALADHVGPLEDRRRTRPAASTPSARACRPSRHRWCRRARSSRPA